MQLRELHPYMLGSFSRVYEGLNFNIRLHVLLLELFLKLERRLFYFH